VKQRVIFLFLSISVAVVLAGCEGAATNRDATNSAASGSATNESSKAASKPSIDEIREVLATHDKALNDKNIDAIMSTFSTHPTTVMLGTGVEERWMGPQEIRAAYTEITKDYDAGTMQTNCTAWKTGGSDEAGTMAWLAAICDCKDSLAGKAREYKLNVSATMEKQEGKWRFVSLHMSNAFQPPVSK
jgi:ketosteroid isomerase-like protein